MVVADCASRVIGTTVRAAASDPKVLAEALHAAWREYRYDMVMVFVDTVVEAEAMGCRVERPDDDNAFYVGPPARPARPADPEQDGRMPVVLEATSRLVEWTRGAVPVLTSLKGPFSLAAFLGGFESFLEHVLTEPEEARALLRVALENQRGFAEAAVRHGGVPFIGDPVASGNLISPGVFREFAAPYLADLVRFIHLTGCWAGLHVCGKTGSLLDQLAGTGADVLSLDEVDFGAARRQLGPDIVLMGNVPTGLMLDGRPEEIAAVARECREKAGLNLVLSTACDVPRDTPPENVKALVAAAREPD